MMSRNQLHSILTISRPHLTAYRYYLRRFLLRKLALLAPFFACLCLVQFASAQQGDIMFGGGTLLSSAATSSQQITGNIAERGGTYLNVAGDVVGFKRRLGIMVETSWRASQAAYIPGQINYRPILTDFNVMFQPKLGKKVGLDLFGGVGIASTRFYYPFTTSCSYFSGCINYTSNHKFMQDAGAGLRYYVWHHVFVRPEIHYYHIDGNNNTNTANPGGFSSNNVFRVGASIGYTIGPD
jgi:opacity protein-like surface antigen